MQPRSLPALHKLLPRIILSIEKPPDLNRRLQVFPMQQTVQTGYEAHQHAKRSLQKDD